MLRVFAREWWLLVDWVVWGRSYEWSAIQRLQESGKWRSNLVGNARKWTHWALWSSHPHSGCSIQSQRSAISSHLKKSGDTIWKHSQVKFLWDELGSFGYLRVDVWVMGSSTADKFFMPAPWIVWCHIASSSLSGVAVGQTANWPAGSCAPVSMHPPPLLHSFLPVTTTKTVKGPHTSCPRGLFPRKIGVRCVGFRMALL